MSKKNNDTIRKEKSKNGMTEPVYREDKRCFELRFTYVNEHGEKKRKSFSGQSIHECNKKRESFLLDLEKIKNGVVISSTIPEILRLENERRLKLNKQKEQGFGRNEDTIKYIEASSIGKIPIKDLTVEQLQYFLCEITHYANDTIKKIYAKIKNAYTIAYRKRVVEDNPFEDPRNELDCPLSDIDTKVILPLTIEDQLKFEAALSEYATEKTACNKYHRQLMIELYSGMRMGEINALTPKDIDFKRGIIHVCKTVSRDRNRKAFISHRPKTKKGIREVPMSPAVEKELIAAIAEMIPNNYNLIFCDKKKKVPLSTQQVNSAYKRICENAGLKEVEQGQHQLRHTFGTRCVEAGVDYKYLSDIMGHSDIHVTIDTYVSTLPTQRETNMDKFEAYRNKIHNN